MNSMIFPILIFAVFMFHLALRPYMRKGRVREGLCALWCIDAVFAVCGTVISFYLYHYAFSPFLTLRNLLLLLIYLVVILLFFLLAPSGLKLLYQKRNRDEETLLLAEYRFNDTLCLIRNFFLILLFSMPIILTLLSGWEEHLRLYFTFDINEMCAVLCLASFFILLPLCLRQSFFWMKNLRHAATQPESDLLLQHSSGLHYRKRNFFL